MNAEPIWDADIDEAIKYIAQNDSKVETGKGGLRSVRFTARSVPFPSDAVLLSHLAEKLPIMPIVEQTAAFAKALATVSPGHSVICLEIVNGGQEIHGYCFMIIGPVELTDYFKGLNVKLARLKLATVIGGVPLFSPCKQAIDAIVACVNSKYPDVDGLYFPAVEQAGEYRSQLKNSELLTTQFLPYMEKIGAIWHEIALPASYDDYLKSLSKKRRYNLSRQRRLLREYFKDEIDFITISTHEDYAILETAIDVLAPPQDAGGAKRYYRACLQSGLLQCYVLHAVGQPIALATGVQYAGELVIHRMYFHRSLADLSPGTCLWQSILEHCCEAGRHSRIVLGFGGVNDATKTKNTVRNVDSIIYLRKNAGSFLNIAPHTIFIAFKAVLKQGTTLTAFFVDKFGASTRRNMRPKNASSSAIANSL